MSASSDARRIATGDNSGVLRVWDTQSQRLLLRYAVDSPDTAITQIAFSPSGKYLATIDSRLVVRVFDVGSETVASAFRSEHSLPASAHILFIDEERLACGIGSSLLVIRRDDGKIVSRLAGHSKEIHGFANGNGGRYLLTSGGDYTVRLWDTRTGTAKRTHQVKPAQGTACPLEICMSKNGMYYAIQNSDFGVTVYETESGKMVQKLAVGEFATSMAIDPSNKTVVIASKEKVALWSIKTGTVTSEIRLPGALSIENILMLKDATSILFTGTNGSLRSWAPGTNVIRDVYLKR